MAEIFNWNIETCLHKYWILCTTTYIDMTWSIKHFQFSRFFRLISFFPEESALFFYLVNMFLFFAYFHKQITDLIWKHGYIKKAKGDPPINENEINRMIDHCGFHCIHFLRLLNKILVVTAGVCICSSIRIVRI